MKTCVKCGGTLQDDDCKLCVMFAAQQAPAVQTDSTFLAGMESQQAVELNNKPQIGAKLSRDLKAIGGSPKGKVYLSGLAAYPGDPEAWISGRGDIKRVADQRNYTVKGAVTRRADSRADDVREEK